MEVFEVVSKINDIETMAWGHGIKGLPLLLKKYGGKPASWRKKKGRAIIRQFGMLLKRNCIGMKHMALAKST